MTSLRSIASFAAFTLLLAPLVACETTVSGITPNAVIGGGATTEAVGVVGTSSCGGVIKTLIGASLSSASSWSPSGVPTAVDAVVFPNSVNATTTTNVSYCSMSLRNPVTINLLTHSIAVTSGFTTTADTGSLMLTNAGAVTVSGTHTFINGSRFSVTGPSTSTVTLMSDFGASGALNTNLVFNGVAVTSTTSQHVLSLTLTNGASFAMPTLESAGPYLFRVHSGFGICSTCFFDIQSNAAIIDENAANPTYTALMGLLSTGWGNGQWNGLGIRSGTIGTAVAGFLANGAGDGFSFPIEGIGVMVNNSIYADWHGEAIGANDTLLKHTYYGDSNLDGRVDGSDYTRIDAGYISHTTGWNNGDFNYDGVVDGTDYTLIDNDFNTQGAAFSEFTFKQ